MASFQNVTIGTVTAVGDRASTAGPLILTRDAAGNALLASGTSVPANATSGYAIGGEFLLNTAAKGQCAWWRNHGTATSCQFRPVGPVVEYGIVAAGGPVTSAGGDTTEVISLPGVATAADISFVEHQTTNDTDTIVAQITSVETISITGSADPSTAHKYSWALLRSGCLPAYDIYAAGTATLAGGNAAEDITISGVLATDIAFATYSATDDSDVIASVAAAANKITVTMSADPSTTHGVHYVVLRPRGSFRPSHYIYAAGVHTTVGGSAAEAITLTGVAATDVAIVHYNTTNDTDTIKKAVLTTNTLTVTMSADPSTAHKLAYMVLRAY